MASVFRKRDRWYLRVKDGAGIWRKISCKARTKTEARQLARDLERQYERQRLGLDPLPPGDGGGTLAELLQWWLDTFSTGSTYHDGDVSTLNKHVLGSELAALPLIAVTPQRIELFLLDKSRQGLAPQTLNHLRGYLSRAFNAARKTGRYAGKNPVSLVARRKVARRPPDFLRAEEVPAVLAALAPRWQPLFATAIYAGLRKGELAGVGKTDVDLNARLLTVARSYDRDLPSSCSPPLTGRCCAGIPASSTSCGVHWGERASLPVGATCAGARGAVTSRRRPTRRYGAARKMAASCGLSPWSARFASTTLAIRQQVF